MTSLRSILACGLMLLLTLPLAAQGLRVEKRYMHDYRIFSIDNGLTSNCITSIVKTPRGEMWLGTNDGLNAFDGYTFLPYEPYGADTLEVMGKVVSDISIIDDNRLAVALADHGFAIYNRIGTTLKTVHIEGSERNPQEYISAYGTCRFKDFTYVAYENNLVKINNQTGEQLHIAMVERRKHTGAEINKVTMVPTPDERYIVMILSLTRLAVLDTQTEKVEVQTTSFFLNDVCNYDSSTMLLATSEGLRSFDLNSRKIEKIGVLETERVHALAADNANNYWISYDNQHLTRWSPLSGKIEEVQGLDRLLNRQTIVNDMMEDNDHVLWLATNDIGLLKIDMKPAKISNVRLPSVDFLPPNYITRDIVSTGPDEITAACGVDGIVFINTKDETYEHVKVNHKNVFTVLRRRNKEFLLGTSTGLLVYTPGKNDLNYEQINISDETITSTANRLIIHDMVEDCLGNVWLGTQLGVYKYNGLYARRIPSGSNNIEKVNAIHEDQEGRIWSGTETGVFVMHPGDTTFVPVDLPDLRDNKLIEVNSFADYVNTMLIGTSQGVMIYDKITQTVKPAAFGEKFSKMTVYSITADPYGIIWLSTNKGIGCIDQNYNQSYIFDEHDGLATQGNDCHKFARDHDIIYIGNATNINYISTRNLYFNQNLPKIFISHVTYGNSTRKGHVSVQNDSTYSFKFFFGSTIRIHLGSSDYSLPTRNEYMYRINDGSWISMVDRNEIIINGEWPGTLKIDVRATNADKVWGDRYETAYIRVVPPLWLNNASLIFYLILIIASIWFTIELRFANMKKRMKHMEGEARAKKVVEDQRNRLSVLHNDQKASIRYAKRIQDSLMPKIEEYSENFKRLFLYYAPRDIVSGDFYCVYYRDNKTFIVLADCTGHGVPGAFISIIGIDNIFNIIMRQKIDDAGEILTHLHRDLHSTVFKHRAKADDDMENETSSAEESRDSMDMTVCVVDHISGTISFSGAMNDLYLIRDNEFTTFRGERHSIGSNNKIDSSVDSKEYPSQTIRFREGDMFYVFSDGITDQLGGRDNKKFKIRRLKQLLLYIHKMPGKDQRALIHRNLIDWKGVNEQTDDISIIGFEPTLQKQPTKV